jgi:hypothetical protein
MDAKVPEVAFSVGEDESCMIVLKEYNMYHSNIGGRLLFVAIQENPAYEAVGIQFDIFVTPFFRQVHSIFDIQGNRFGVIKMEDNELSTLRKSPNREEEIKEEDEITDNG